MPDDPKTAATRRSMDLYRLLESSGRLVAGEAEFVNAKEFRGVAIEADGADGIAAGVPRAARRGGLGRPLPSL